MNKTPICWVKNPDGTQGYTWNPITGCLNNCPYCYARKLANGRLKSRYLANTCLPTHDEPNHEAHHSDPFYPRFWPERLNDLNPYKHKHPQKPRGIFVCDMSDLLGIGIPEGWTRKVFDCITEFPEHRFYLLTKQPQNLIEFSPFPGNCFVGVTATDNGSFLSAMQYLASIKASVKYLSIEPFLESIYVKNISIHCLDWVIIGAMTFRGGISGSYPQLTPMSDGKLDTLQPKIEWVQEIVQACGEAGIPVFLKENLRPLLQQNKHNLYSFPEWAGTQFAVTGDRSLAPVNPHPNEAMRRLRQELPK